MGRVEWKMVSRTCASRSFRIFGALPSEEKGPVEFANDDHLSPTPFVLYEPCLYTKPVSENIQLCGNFLCRADAGLISPMTGALATIDGSFTGKEQAFVDRVL
jgi:hypothetical protein